jgi:hypothetical protein
MALISLIALLGLSVSSPAFAAGRVVWKTTTVTEHTKKEAWYLELEIYLPRAPDVGQKGMKFEFTQVAEFERSLVDGRDGPQERTIPLSNQQALIESQLVGFMDAGSGTIQSRTKFSFKVTRAHGYRAGEYKVKIKDSDTGNLIGTESKLIFKGENPVVDRRSIVFTGTEKKKDDSAAASDSGPKNMVDLNAPDEPTSGNPNPSAASEPSPDVEPMDSGDAPPSVDERPGGGCHYGVHDQGGWALGMVLGFLAVVLLGRRRFQ